MNWWIASMTSVTQLSLDNITELIAAGSAIFAGVCAIITAWMHVRDRKRDREHSVRMEQVAVYEAKNAEAIEKYVTAVSDCAMRCEITEEFKQISSKIYLHVDFRQWKNVDAVNATVWRKDFLNLPNELTKFCQWANWADFSKARLAEELTTNANKSVFKKLKDKISR